MSSPLIGQGEKALSHGQHFTLGVEGYFNKQCVCMCVCVCVCVHVHTQAYLTLLATPWTVAHQASLPVGFPRQAYWNGLLFPSPGDIPDPGRADS